MASDRCLNKPDWQRRAQPRLAKSMVLAMFFIAAVLLLIKIPSIPIFQQAVIELRLMVEEPVEPKEASPPEEPVPVEVFAAEEPLVEETQIAEVLPAESTDWQADVSSAVQEVVSTANTVESMHPTHAEKRRLAAFNFAPSEAPIKKPIWENVETDYIGRKVLINGDCYRVLEDWRATYQEIQRDFGQFINYCNASGKETMDVKWVEEIQQKYAYLRHPDGNIPRDELDVLLRRFDSQTQE